MAPKKVMKAGTLKQTSKKQTLMKGPKTKQTLMKGTKTKQTLMKGPKEKQTLVKGQKKVAKPGPKPKKSSLTKAKLAQLGKLSLKEKVEKITEEAETKEEAAQVLKEAISPNERGQIWSKHQIALKTDQEAQKEHSEMNKTQKGLASLLWFVENQSKKNYNATAQFGTKQTLIKGDTWKSEKQMLEDFGLEEFQLHVQSGRIQWRNDPYTEGVYNYKDLNDVKGQTEVTRKRNHSMGIEVEASDLHEEGFMKNWSKGQHHLLEDIQHGSKGAGKSSSSKGNKGAGKGGKARGKGQGLLALTNGEDEEKEKKDKDEDEKTAWNKCLVKAQKAKEGCILAIANMEEAVGSAQKAGRLTKATRKDYEAMMKEVEVKAEKLKKLLKLKGSQYSLENAKALIQEAANKTKELKDETKECIGLANKAGSKASTSKK